MSTTSQLYIGPAGWSYKDWEGKFYPPDLKKRKQSPLHFLAQYFDLAEINTSFYGPVKPAVAQGWLTAVRDNPRFLFTAKLYRGFTHSPVAVVESTSFKTIRPAPDDEQLTKAGLDELAAAGRLGAVLAQFPISFKNNEDNRQYLAELVQRFRQYPLAVEVRHATWNDENTLREFAEQGVAFCNIDQPLLGRALRPTTHVTSSIGYIRLHGRRYDQWFTAEHGHDRYSYLYSADELTGWKTRIEKVANKAEKTFVVANNHFEGKAAANSLELKYMLGGARVHAPQTLVHAYPRLRDIAETS